MTSMVRPLLLVAAFGALFAGGCSDPAGPSPRELSALGDGLILTIAEELAKEHWASGVGEPALTLTVTTRRGGYCAVGINVDVDVQGSTVVLTAADLAYTGQACLGPAPARFSEQLAIPDGSYTLLVRHGRFTDRYRLLLSPSAITLDPLAVPGFTEARFDVFWRFPTRTFAHYCWPEQADPGRCAALDEALRGAVGLMEFTFSGGVVPFSYALGAQGTGARATYFRFDEEEDFARVRSVYCTHLAANPGPGGTRLISWKREEVVPWAGQCRQAGAGASIL